MDVFVHGRFIITGRLWLTPKRVLKRRIKALGGVVYRSFRRGPQIVDAVVTGDDPDHTLIAQAEHRGVPVIDEAEFNEALGLFESANERFSELRGELQRGQSRAGWARVCAMLELWPQDEGPERAVRYALDHTANWDPKLKRNPAHWAWRAANGVPEPRLAICQTLVLNHPLTRGHVRNLGDALAGQEILHVDMSSMWWSFDPATLEHLANHPLMRHVRSLNLGGIDLTRGVGDLLMRAPYVANVERIHQLRRIDARLYNDMMQNTRSLKRLKTIISDGQWWWTTPTHGRRDVGLLGAPRDDEPRWRI